MIDVYNVITNGILTKDNTVKIIDPLGYFVILVEEEIVEISIDSGSTPSGLRKSKGKQKQTKLVKRIKLTVCGLDDTTNCYEEVVDLSDVNLNVSGVNFVNNEIHLTVSGESIDDQSIIIQVKNVGLQ